MARCDHGFERSVVPCPVCDRGIAEEAADRAEGRTRPAPSVRRVRGQGEVITREGSFRCRKCRELKPLSAFYVSRSLTRGHQSMCRVCDNNKRAERLREATRG